MRVYTIINERAVVGASLVCGGRKSADVIIDVEMATHEVAARGGAYWDGRDGRGRERD